MLRLPILRGRLRGRWWLPASRGKLLRIFNGTYERAQTRAFEERLRDGHTLLDVGANAGYYTLLGSELVGERGRIFSFEPDPGIAGFLRRHVEMNGRRNVRVEEAAVSDTNGTAHFATGSGSGTGRLDGAGGFEVRTLRLDDFCAQHGVRPDAIKIDVEGAELKVLAGARETIRSARPVVFLSTHGAEVHRACIDWMSEQGYGLSPIEGDDVASTTELLCVPMIDEGD